MEGEPVHAGLHWGEDAEERAYANKLLEMTNQVDAAGSKVVQDLANEAFQEFVKRVLK